MKKQEKNTYYGKLTAIIEKVEKGDALKAGDVITLAAAVVNMITTAMSGKMAGLWSLSTSTLLNPQCAKNAAVVGSICSKCYARAMLKLRKSLREKLEINTRILTAVIIPFECLPVINNLYFRFEAFGDLMTSKQVVNYFNICKKNPAVSFALWTKNPHLIQAAIDTYKIEKPQNLNIIYSPLFMNVNNGKTIIKKYPFIDKVFTVYTLQYVQDHPETVINCGGRSCINCLNCYKKGGNVYVNEMLKQDQKKAVKAGVNIG